MPDFDRSRAWMDRSIAYAVFRSQFTELNSQYWAGVPSELLSRRFVAEHDGDDDFKTALQVRSDSWNAVGHSVARVDPHSRGHLDSGSVRPRFHGHASSAALSRASIRECREAMAT